LKRKKKKNDRRTQFVAPMIRKVDYFISETNSLQSRLAEMEDGLLSVDATNNIGNHFAVVVISHASCDRDLERLLALKPNLDLIWKCISRHGIVHRILFEPCAEYLWTNLDIVEKHMCQDSTRIPSVTEELRKRRWLESARRAWIAAVVFSLSL
jgi:hypothetical protein